jgi:3-oxoacyl-[acyl-carrier-protein] synthase-3
VEVSGVSCAVPEAVRTLEDLQKTFGVEQSRRIAKSVGVDRRHVSTGGLCTSDLCFVAAERLLEKIKWERESIDLLVFVSVTPDYVAPATACTLQHRLKLNRNCAAFDVSHACSAYPYGLWIVSNLISCGSARRALLLVGDTVSRLVSPQDQATAPLFGDAGSATAIQCNEATSPLSFELGSDGGGARHLMVKHGKELHMNGTEVFAFTLREVPALTHKILDRAGWTFDDVDAVVMHQASLFMVQHLAKKMHIPKEKVILNLDEYGNTSAASIPLALSTGMADDLRRKSKRLILLGFGAGFSWGGVALTCGPLQIPEVAIVKPDAGLL